MLTRQRGGRCEPIRISQKVSPLLNLPYKMTVTLYFEKFSGSSNSAEFLPGSAEGSASTGRVTQHSQYKRKVRKEARLLRVAQRRLRQSNRCLSPLSLFEQHLTTAIAHNGMAGKVHRQIALDRTQRVGQPAFGLGLERLTNGTLHLSRKEKRN